MIKLLSIKDSSCGASTDLGLPEPRVSTKVVSTGRLKVWASLLLLLLLLLLEKKEDMRCNSIPPIDSLFALSRIQIKWLAGGDEGTDMH